MTYSFRLAFQSVDEFERELELNLRRGRTFVRGVEAAADRSPCVLQVEHPGTGVIVELRGEVVFVQAEGAAKGVGVQLTEPELEGLLQAFLAVLGPVSDPPVERSPEQDIAVGDPLHMGRPSGELLLPLVGFGLQRSSLGESSAPAELCPSGDVVEIVSAPRADSERVDPAVRQEPAAGRESALDNVHARVRRLSPAERERLARSGNLTERTALERAFGGAVWEGLLQNGQLTGAEVARIAKNGTAPAHLLAQIANNAGWLSRAEVRRALLQNRRLSAPQVDAVLRATPQSELRLMAQQAGYPARVREAAKRLIRL